MTVNIVMERAKRLPARDDDERIPPEMRPLLPKFFDRKSGLQMLREVLNVDVSESSFDKDCMRGVVNADTRVGRRDFYFGRTLWKYVMRCSKQQTVT